MSQAEFNSGNRLSVDEAERFFVRRLWWLLPVIGVAAGVLAARYGWYVVTLAPETIGAGWLRGLKMPYLLIPMSAMLSLAVWIGTGRLERRMLGDRAGWRLAVSGIVAVLLLVVCECAVRTGAVQSAFWMAVQRRSIHDEDFFSREVAGIRWRALHEQPGGGVVLAGTSQIMHGMDSNYLQEKLFPTVVKRRTLANMFPLRILGVWKYLDVGAEDRLILYWSEFDLAASVGLETDWLRPVVSWEGLKSMWYLGGEKFSMASWRSWVDMGCAASSELWRMRDYAKILIWRIAGTPELVKAQAAEEARIEQMRAFGEDARSEERLAEGIRYAEGVIYRAAEQGARVIVFEGQVNPKIETEATRAMHGRVVDWLEAQAQSGVIRFVSRQEQDFETGDGDWRDGTHLSASGRDKLTASVLAVLREEER